MTEYDITSGVTSTGLTLNGDRMNISNGGLAIDTAINSNGYMYVSSGGMAEKTAVNSIGYLVISSGGRANSTTVNSKAMLQVCGGGMADGVTVKTGGWMTVSSGATATGVVWTPCEGHVAVYGGATVKFKNKLSGVYYGSGGKQLEHDAVMDGKTLDSGCELVVMNGGTATNATVNSGGSIYVHSGGRANDAIVNSGGSICVYTGGAADHATLNESGRLFLHGGTATNATVLTGGIMVVSSGGILTGSQTYANGASVTLFDGACVLFDVSGMTAADCANPFLNNLALVAGNPTFTLAVSAVQSFGTYTLADWVTGFDKPVTVVNDAWEDTGVTLEVGVSKDIFGASHSLQIIGSELVLIVGESENMEPADNGWNDTLYDKKSKKLNERVYGMDALAVTADTRELLIDTAGTVRALDDMHNFIGNSPSSGRLDTADFTKIELATAAKLSFNAYSGQAAKFTVWQLVEGKDKKGATTYTMKSLTSATLKGGYAGVSTSKKPLLLEAGTYYVSMELSNAKKADEDGYYSVTIDDSPSATEFYTRADNSDDWKDMKTDGQNGRYKMLGALTEDSFEGFLVSDEWVGFSDSIDYMQFELQTAAKLGFYIGATDATKFTIWQLNEKNGKNGATIYSLKSLQSVTLKKEGEYNYYADTYDKPVILDAGTYYMSVESTNAKKGGSATYSISLSGGEFYTRVDNGDDWGDMKTDGAKGLVGTVGTLSAVGVILEDWVGYGDAIDYKEFTLTRKTSLSFSVFSGDAAKFTVWRLDGKTDKKGVTTYSLKALGSVKIAAGNVEQTQGFNLDAGSYYFSMESVNAKKGASCDYTVELASFVESDSLSAALAMPEADALADVGSFDKLEMLDDKAAWGSLLA